ncbi:MAG TPA: RNA polymerase sigma factor [Solirubrobacterales bacterium]|nr:RNA polymerase sigma factor [Solirubrobacterales bacterium]
METELALDQPPSSLSRHLALKEVRDGGVRPAQVHLIASDPEIFEVFYRQHVEAIQGFIARRVGDRERAADLTAEIFLAAIGAAHRYQPRRGSPKAWLYGIAQNVIAIDRRRAGREQAREERFGASALLDENDAAAIDARIDAATERRDLYRAMERLSETERAVLELVAIDELSLAEAAAAVRVRPVTARVRLHRARRKLRAELEAAAATKPTNPTTNQGEPR